MVPEGLPEAAALLAWPCGATSPRSLRASKRDVITAQQLCSGTLRPERAGGCLGAPALCICRK